MPPRKPDLSHIYEPGEIPGLLAAADGRPFFALVNVTPEWATELLVGLHADELPDRPAVPARIARLQRAADTGRWWLSWDCIAIDTGGRRRNGRHRLMAIANSGRPQIVGVLFNVEPDAVRIGDQGAKRTMAQVLTLDGEEHPADLASALRLLWQWLNGYRIGDQSQKAAPSITEMYDVLYEHEGIRDHCLPGHRISERGQLAAKGLSIVLSYVLGRADPDEAEAFFDHLCTGAGLDKDDPILQLRHRLVDLKAQTGTKGTNVTYKAALTIKAFNAWRQRDLRQLRWRQGGRHPEPFPVINLAESGAGDPVELPS
jgi:hypothetical protein